MQTLTLDLTNASADNLSARLRGAQNLFRRDLLTALFTGTGDNMEAAAREEAFTNDDFWQNSPFDFENLNGTLTLTFGDMWAEQ